MLAPLEAPSASEMNDLLLRLMHGVNKNVFALLGDQVKSGPFTGMRVPSHTPWGDGNESTKMLGVYEHELHPVIEYAVWRRPEVVINVGCAEGYYAIGMARLLSESAQVFALDKSDEALELCKEYANINGVWVECHNSSGRLLSPLIGRRLYIVDIEGGEEQFIDLEANSALVESDIIVECHDFMKPGISSILADRLARTHRVELIQPQLPDLSQFAFARQMPSIMTMLALIEKRPMPCYWLACWANRRGSDG